MWCRVPVGGEPEAVRNNGSLCGVCQDEGVGRSVTSLCGVCEDKGRVQCNIPLWSL